MTFTQEKNKQAYLTVLLTYGRACLAIFCLSYCYFAVSSELFPPTRLVFSEPEKAKLTKPSVHSSKIKPAKTCGTSVSNIHLLQGEYNSSPLLNEQHTVEAVVTLISEHLKGFFIQAEPSTHDDNPLTSEAIFVYYPKLVPVTLLGHKIRLKGKVQEYYGRTQLTQVTGYIDCGLGDKISPIALSLPYQKWEKHEGMLVTFTEQLTVTDNQYLAKYGQLTLSRGRLVMPTQLFKPGSQAAQQLTQYNRNNRIILDDGNNQIMPEALAFQTTHFTGESPVRTGDTVTGLTGVLDYAFKQYRLLTVKPVKFLANKARPKAIKSHNSDLLKVASFNVFNYFNGDGDGQGFPAIRGAKTAIEFIQQRSKILAALSVIDADIVGLMELENDGFAADSSIADIVNGLNQRLGHGRYAYVSVAQQSLGTDAITVGLIYKPSRVALLGPAVTLNKSVFTQGNRPPLVQTFKELSSKQVFTVAVNHFKSKGGCARAKLANKAQKDGQGCWNQLRTEAANELSAWLASNPTGSQDEDILIMGDLNAYAQEDPIQRFIFNGYFDLLQKYLGRSAYSYRFAGQLGYLDHALANKALLSQVTAVQVWHINADEANVLGYRQSHTQVNWQNYFSESIYRSSDHDPVIIWLNLH